MQQTTTKNLTTFESTIDSHKMSISMDNMSKLFDFFQAPYSDPIGSIVREIASNCWDANIAAKQNEPIIIKVGYDENGLPFIEFIDKGLGMTPEFMKTTYDVYTVSEKENTNDQIGYYGIGSKSPFSYNDEFFLTTTTGGKKYEYLMLKDENNMPSRLLLEESDTNNPSGTSVKIMIKSDKDLDSFIYAIDDQLGFFEQVFVYPINITNKYLLKYIENFNNKVLVKYTDHHTILINDNIGADGKIVLLIGQVSYPMQNPKQTNSNYILGINFKIGELSVTPTRESIRWTKKQIEFVDQRFLEIKPILGKKLAETLSYNKNNLNIGFLIKNQDFGGIPTIQINNKIVKIKTVSNYVEYKEFAKESVYVTENGQKVSIKDLKDVYEVLLRNMIEKNLLFCIINADTIVVSRAFSIVEKTTNNDIFYTYYSEKELTKDELIRVYKRNFNLKYGSNICVIKPIQEIDSKLSDLTGVLKEIKDLFLMYINNRCKSLRLVGAIGIYSDILAILGQNYVSYFHHVHKEFEISRYISNIYNVFLREKKVIKKLPTSTFNYSLYLHLQKANFAIAFENRRSEKNSIYSKYRDFLWETSKIMVIDVDNPMLDILIPMQVLTVDDLLGKNRYFPQLDKVYYTLKYDQLMQVLRLGRHYDVGIMKDIFSANLIKNFETNPNMETMIKIANEKLYNTFYKIKENSIKDFQRGIGRHKGNIETKKLVLLETKSYKKYETYQKERKELLSDIAILKRNQKLFIEKIELILNSLKQTTCKKC